MGSISPMHNHRPTELILIRHGQTEGNLRRLLVGRTDMPLDDVGRRQAAATADFAAASYQPDLIVSSPLVRARDTAERIGSRIGLPVEIEPGLVELDFGDVEGWAIEEALTDHPHMAEVLLDPNGGDYSWPNGEMLGDFHRRVAGCFAVLAERHRGHHVIVVTHGGVIGSYYAQIDGRNPNDFTGYHFDNCSVTRVEIAGGAPRILETNLTAHLHQVESETEMEAASA
jgi:probable phosphoglycerate mutase